VLVVVPAAIVLAVGAALVHGFVNSGSRTTHASAQVVKLAPALRQNPRAVGPTTTTAEKAVHRSVQHDAYALQQSNTAAVASGSALNGLTAAPDSLAIPRHRVVHAVASLQVGVKSSELSDKTNRATQIVGSLGGYAQSVRYQATHSGQGESYLTLKVPVQNAQAAITKLGGLGKLLSQEVSTQDLQARLTHQNSAIGSLRRAISVYENALNSGTLSATERVAIQIKLNNARHALVRLRHARNGTLASGANADISLLLTTRNHAVGGGHHNGGSTRIGRLLGSAAHFLALEGIIVLYALIVLAPVLLLGALAWWILRERRRREERLLASA
jgi:hypothetical protein